MSQVDGGMRVSDYLRQWLRTIDGLAWVATVVISVVYLVDILSGLHLLPRPASTSAEKAAVLFASSPLLIFMILLRSRVTESASSRVAGWSRAALCLAVFSLINFWPTALKSLAFF